MGKKRDAEQRRRKYLIDKYLRIRTIDRGRRHFPENDGWYEVRTAVDQLRRANEVLDFLDRSGRDPYRTFADIKATLFQAREGLAYTRSPSIKRVFFPCSMITSTA